MSPVERGLWDAVLARPGDDLARLVYADYLEEAGRAPLANFIRAQIHLAQCPPGHPDYADAVEAQSLAVAGARGASSLPAPALPDGATFAGSVREIEGDGYGSYARGFADRVAFSGLRMRTGPGELARALTRVVAETTVRGLDLAHIPESGLAELLACPAAGELTGLGVTIASADFAECRRLLAERPRLAGIKRFALGLGDTMSLVVGMRLALGEWIQLAPEPWLAGATSYAFHNVGMLNAFRDDLGPAVTSLTVHNLTGTPRVPMETLGSSRLAGLKHLRLPAVAVDSSEAQELARLPLAPLAALHLTDAHLGTGAIAALLSASYLTGLTELALTGPRAPAAALLRADAVRLSLRLLYLDGAISDGATLAELARPGLLPESTTLSVKRPPTRSDYGLVLFAEAWRGERLHTLILDGWPAPAAALARLAANPAFASLRRLKLSRCGVSDAGGVALARSRHLQNLVELDVSFNTLGEKAAALFSDPSVMPRLVLADLTTNRMHPDTRTSLRAARPGFWA